MPAYKKIKKYMSLIKAVDENILSMQDFLINTVYTCEFAEYYKTHYFKKEIINSVKTNQISTARPFEAFELLLNENMSMAETANLLLTKYMIDNSKTEKENKDDYLKILLNQITAKAFEEFLKGKYQFIFNPNEKTENEEYNLDAFEVKIDDINQSFYLLSRLIPNSVVNDLRNSYVKFLQFTQDLSIKFTKLSGISKNQNEVLNLISYTEEEIEKIIYTLKIVSEYNNMPDENTNDLSVIKPFVENVNNKIYSQDDKRVIMHKSIVNLKKNFLYYKFSNFYNSNNILKVSNAEVNEFADSDDKQIKTISQKLKDSKSSVTLNEWQQLNKYISLKNRVLLQDISDYSQIFNQIEAHMISHCYKWERDTYYFLIGWDCLKNNNIIIDPKIEDILKPGFNNNLKSYLKNNGFDNNHYTKLFEDFCETRNKIDHFYGYKNFSLFDILKEQYLKFRYDKKLQNSIFVFFVELLKKYKIDIKNNVIIFDENKNIHLNLKEESVKMIKIKLKVGESKKYLNSLNKNANFGFVFMQLLEFKI